MLFRSDLLKGLSKDKGHRSYIGFCLVDDDLKVVAKKKMKDKGLDYILANSPDAIGSDVRDVIIYGRDDTETIIQGGSVFDIAYALCRLIV